MTSSTNNLPPIEYATPQPRRQWWPKMIIVFGVMAVPVVLFVTVFIINEWQQGNRAMNRIHCASQMRALGDVMKLFAAENRSSYPPDLSTLLHNGSGCVPEMFVCPGGDGEIAAASFSSDTAARAANNLDFVYVGEGLKNNVNAEEPILFERVSDHDHDGGNVLFGDGHVEFFMKPAILKLLEPLKGTPRLTDEEYNAIVAP